MQTVYNKKSSLPRHAEARQKPAIKTEPAGIAPREDEEQFGYTAQLTGELMVPGALLMFALIPLVGRVVMPLVQTGS